MRARGANGVGRFSVEFEVANYGDLTLMQRGLLPPDRVRRETIQGMVDSGPMKLVLPQAVVKRLGLPLGNPVKVLMRLSDRPSRSTSANVQSARRSSPASTSSSGNPPGSCGKLN